MAHHYKKYFPLLRNNPGLVYLDSAATTQKPDSVIEAMNNFYIHENANIHRGAYDLSDRATKKYENTRIKVAEFLEAESEDCIAFTKGTTESINIVAKQYLKPRLKNGDNIVVTIMEHHANFIPWQMVAEECGAELRIAKLNSDGAPDFTGLLDKNTRLLCTTHISNTLGTIIDIAGIIEEANNKEIPVLIDAAQSAAFYDIRKSTFNYDFLAFSGHKIFGPPGTGILYTAPDKQRFMTPYNYGGGIVSEVTTSHTRFISYPRNMDAGTPNIPGVTGLGAALDFIWGLKRNAVLEYIHDLRKMAVKSLSEIENLVIIGPQAEGSGIISFTMDPIHPHDIATFLNKDGIAVRAGMHCTQPLLKELKIPATVRVSLSLYNTKEDIEKLKKSLIEIVKLWS